MAVISSKQALRMAQHALIGSDSAQIDSELLLSASLGVNRASLYAWPERVLSTSEQSRFESLLERRILGEPIAYILEQREFWSLRLRVNCHVLIPRPETELLVETTLSLFAPAKIDTLVGSGLAREHAPAHAELSRASPALTKVLRVADLGTGSGAIALALASERPLWQLVATDQSAEALRVASDNATQLGIRNVSFRQGSWCEALPEGLFDIIVSNPPYIDPQDGHLFQGDLRFEPLTALAAPDTGLADLRAICRQAPRHLTPGGALLLEHGFKQGPAVAQFLAEAGFTGIRILLDINNLPRVTVGILSDADVS